MIGSDLASAKTSRHQEYCQDYDESRVFWSLCYGRSFHKRGALRALRQSATVLVTMTSPPAEGNCRSRKARVSRASVWSADGLPPLFSPRSEAPLRHRSRCRPHPPPDPNAIACPAIHPVVHAAWKLNPPVIASI